ncbi:hypothetical protein BDW02DRAFT_95730 [Decorospora gaudefroyi]|uniref:Secreted protein n=1 Tax=Decorospora gaudefroyi TaxID=184978 RepID=A0A6A5KR27_9PLEO|nr:hypothetical protein BDW02DRAFT_95730 [Decorospora gaudefroyi]
MWLSVAELYFFLVLSQHWVEYRLVASISLTRGYAEKQLLYHGSPSVRAFSLLASRATLRAGEARDAKMKTPNCWLNQSIARKPTFLLLLANEHLQCHLLMTPRHTTAPRHCGSSYPCFRRSPKKRQPTDTGTSTPAFRNQTPQQNSSHSNYSRGLRCLR